VTEIDVHRDLGALLRALEPRPEVVFNALHGRYGEDGHMQALLNILAIPYTHSGMLASAIAMDKARSKEVFRAAGLKCPEGHLLRVHELPGGILFDPPYVIKPNNEGSSVGVHIVMPGDNRPITTDWKFGEIALVEPYIPGRELTVAVMGDHALPSCARIRASTTTRRSIPTARRCISARRRSRRRSPSRRWRPRSSPTGRSAAAA